MNTEQYKNKKILITGASGFVGKNLTKELKKQGFTYLLTPTSSEVDFTIENDVKHYFASYKPEIVLHIAGLVGGIAANKARPAEFL